MDSWAYCLNIEASEADSLEWNCKSEQGPWRDAVTTPEGHAHPTSVVDLSGSILQRATHAHAVMAMVAAGLELALVPATCMRIHTDNLLFKPLSEPLSVEPEIHLCWNRESESWLVEGFLATVSRFS